MTRSRHGDDGGRLRVGFVAVALASALASAAAESERTAFDTVSRLQKQNTLRIAFGSCHKTKYPHDDVWRSVKALEPDVFLWTGDAVYTSSDDRRRFGSVGALERAYKNMTAPGSPYSQFVDSAAGPAFIDGTWDDHDMGSNDGGKHVPRMLTRQRLFLDFIGVPADSPRRKMRSGLYSAHRYIMPNPHPDSKGQERSVSVIILDTRSHRDNHIIPSVGGISWLPLGAVIAAFSRALTSGMDHPGDVLGDNQWEWLNSVLGESSPVSNLTIIVSSVQVFTSNPFVESWSHFPRARDRLINLIEKHNPRGAYFISGDVHYSELSALPGGRVVEVTSSGLTHSCTSPFWGGVCPDILSLFASHRDHVQGRSSYTGRNFGTVDLNWGLGTATTSVHDAHTGKVVAKFSQSLHGDHALDVATLRRWARRWRLNGSTVAGRCLAIVCVCGITGVAVILSLCGCRRCSRAPGKKSWEKLD